MPYDGKRAIQNSEPNIVIAQEEDGKRWTVIFEAFMTMESKFELGVEYEEAQPFSGATNKAVATLEDDGTVLKIVSQTDRGDIIKVTSMTLRDDGKELKVVSVQRKVS